MRGRHGYLGHGPSEQQGPVRHPAAPGPAQAAEAGRQQGQAVEQVHQHLPEGNMSRAHTAHNHMRLLCDHPRVSVTLLNTQISACNTALI